MNQPANPQQSGQAQGGRQPRQVKTREATPEEQQKYEQITREALLMITEKPERFDAFMQAVEAGAPRPTQAVAQIVAGLMDKAEQRAGQIERDSVLEGVAEALITEVYNIAVEEGILDQQVMNEDVFAATYLEFATIWAKSHPERLDEKDQRALEKIMALEQAQGGQGGGGQSQPSQQPEPRQRGGMIAEAGGTA